MPSLLLYLVTGRRRAEEGRAELGRGRRGEPGCARRAGEAPFLSTRAAGLVGKALLLCTRSSRLARRVTVLALEPSSVMEMVESIRKL